MVVREWADRSHTRPRESRRILVRPDDARAFGHEKVFIIKGKNHKSLETDQWSIESDLSEAIRWTVQQQLHLWRNITEREGFAVCSLRIDVDQFFCSYYM